MKIDTRSNFFPAAIEVVKRDAPTSPPPPGFVEDPVKRIDSANRAETIADRIKNAQKLISSTLPENTSRKQEIPDHLVEEAVRAYKQW